MDCYSWPIVDKTSKEIFFLTALSGKIDGKELQELTLSNKHICQIVMIQWTIDDHLNFCVCQPNTGLQLLQLSQKSIIVMNLDLLLSFESFADAILLFF